MLTSLAFWAEWPRAYKQLFAVCALVLAACLVLFWWSYYHSPAPALTWQTIQDLDVAELPVHTFRTGPFELTVPADNYILFERLLGNPLQPRAWPAYTYLAVLMLAMVMWLALITVLSRFWYLAGMGVFILFVASFRLELLEPFGRADKTYTLASLALLAGTSFYIHYFRSTLPFTTRLLIFFLVTVALGIGIHFTAGVPQPFLYMATSGVTAGILLTGLLIVTVAHEVLAGFVAAVSQSTMQGKSLNHFLIISVIYMLNLAMAYAQKFDYLSWGMVTLDPFLLLSISFILGIWGIRQRQPQFEGIIDTEPFMVYAMVMLGSVAFALLSFFMASANDPALDAVHDIVLFTHLGFGIIFLLYIFSNFMAMLAQNLPAYRVLYKPNRMPYFTFRFGGIVATLAFLFYNTWQVPVHNCFASFYNAMGDLYLLQQNDNLADAYFQQAGTYGFMNHHANYGLANIEARRRTSKEKNYYDRAVYKRPTEMAYLNLARVHDRNGNTLEAILTLAEGLQKMPNSGALANTLALFYAKLETYDSAQHFLQQAAQTPATANMAKANLIGLIARQNSTALSPDSLYHLLESPQLAVKSNALAFASKRKEKIDIQPNLASDTVLNVFSATLISNYIVNQLGKIDTAETTTIEKLANKEINKDYREVLYYSCALARYANGQVAAAFELLLKAATQSYFPGKYFNILALWALEQNEPEAALQFLNQSLNQQFDQALLTYAVALSELRDPRALLAWDSVRRDTAQRHLHLRPLAEKMIRVLAIPANMVNKLTDADLYAYCRYRLTPADSSEVYRLAAKMRDPNYRVRTLLELSKKWYAQDELTLAINAYRKLAGLNMTDPDLYADVTHFELRMLARKGDTRLLAQRINESVKSFDGRLHEKVYYTALINLAAGDSVNATKNFEWLGSANPYFEEGIVAAANFFQTDNNRKAYNLLADAVQLHPRSVAIRKAYCLEAARQGFSSYVQSSIETLTTMISPRALQKFLNDHRQLLSEHL
jgi:Flp pilus assembly protein TadD